MKKRITMRHLIGASEKNLKPKKEWKLIKLYPSLTDTKTEYRKEWEKLVILSDMLVDYKGKIYIRNTKVSDKIPSSSRKLRSMLYDIYIEKIDAFDLKDDKEYISRLILSIWFLEQSYKSKSNIRKTLNQKLKALGKKLRQ